jgi:hypothetical protein
MSFQSIFKNIVTSFKYKAVCLSESGRRKFKSAAYRENGAWMFITRLELEDYVEKLEAHKDFKSLRNTKIPKTLDLQKILNFEDYFPNSIEFIPGEDIRFSIKYKRTPTHFINSQGVKAVLEAQAEFTYADGPDYEKWVLLTAKTLIDRIEIDESFERLLSSDEEYSYPIGIGHPNGIENFVKLKPDLHINWPADSSKKRHKAELKNRYRTWADETNIFQDILDWLATIRWLVWVFASLSLGLTVFWKGLPFREILVTAGCMFIFLWLVEMFLKFKTSERKINEKVN